MSDVKQPFWIHKGVLGYISIFKTDPNDSMSEMLYRNTDPLYLLLKDGAKQLYDSLDGQGCVAFYRQIVLEGLRRIDESDTPNTKHLQTTLEMIQEEFGLVRQPTLANTDFGFKAEDFV